MNAVSPKAKEPGLFNGINLFYIMGIFFIPFDSFPIFPLETSHRPITVFPLLIYIFFQIIYRKIPKLALQLGLLYLILVFYTFFTGYLWHGSFRGLGKFAYTSTILYLLIFSSVCFFQSYKTNNRNITKDLGKIIIITSIIPLIVGWIQLLSLFGILPMSVFDDVTHLFSYRVHFHRIQMTCGEPSKSVRLIFLLSFLSLPIAKKQYWYLIFMGNLLLMFFFSASSLGFMMIPAILFFQILLFPSFKLFKIFFGALLISILIGRIGWELLPAYTTNRLENLFDLVLNLSYEEVVALASIDGSFFTRVFHPIIGFHMTIENWGVGVGGESYFYQFPSMINKYYNFATYMKGTTGTSLSGENMATPFSMYSKIASEFGILGISFFIGVNYRVYKKIKAHIKKFPDEKYYSWILSFSLALIAFYASYIYFHYVLVIFFLLFKFDLLNPIRINGKKSYLAD